MSFSMNSPSFSLSAQLPPWPENTDDERRVHFPPPSDASRHERWKLLGDFHFSCSFVGLALQYPQAKEKFPSGEPSFAQPQMPLEPLKVTPGTQFHWLLSVNLPNSMRKERERLPFPRECSCLPSQANPIIHAWCSSLHSLHLNTLPPTQRTLTYASKNTIQPRPPQSRGEERLVTNGLTSLESH